MKAECFPLTDGWSLSKEKHFQYIIFFMSCASIIWKPFVSSQLWKIAFQFRIKMLIVIFLRKKSETRNPVTLIALQGQQQMQARAVKNVTWPKRPVIYSTHTTNFRRNIIILAQYFDFSRKCTFAFRDCLLLNRK